MLFVSYWEINENKPPAEILEAGAKLVESELWPPEGVEIIRWDLTSDNWGVTVFEADTVEAAERVVTVWRLAVPGIFTKTKTAPAGPADQAMLDFLDMMDTIPAEA